MTVKSSYEASLRLILSTPACCFPEDNLYSDPNMAFGPEQEQPKGAEERQRFVAPKTTPGEPETTSGEQAGSAGDGQTVFDEVAELKRQLAQTQAEIARRDQEAQAQRERRRASNAAAKKRWKERHPERAREQHTKHMQTYRARKRGQGS